MAPFYFASVPKVNGHWSENPASYLSSTLNRFKSFPVLLLYLISITSPALSPREVNGPAWGHRWEPGLAWGLPTVCPCTHLWKGRVTALLIWGLTETLSGTHYDSIGGRKEDGLIALSSQ